MPQQRVRCLRCQKMFVTSGLGNVSCPNCNVLMPVSEKSGITIDAETFAEAGRIPTVKPMPDAGPKSAPKQRRDRPPRARQSSLLPFFLIGGGTMLLLLLLIAGLIGGLVWYQTQSVNATREQAVANDKSKPVLNPAPERKPMPEFPLKETGPKNDPAPPNKVPEPPKPADNNKPPDTPKPPENPKPAEDPPKPPDKAKPMDDGAPPDKPKPEKPEKPEKPAAPSGSDWIELGGENPFPEIIVPSEEVAPEKDGLHINRRHYLKTKSTDYFTKDWKLEVVFTLKRGDDAVFVGFGEADRTGEYNEPKNSVFLRISPPVTGRDGYVNVGNGPNKSVVELGKIRKDGTHRAVITKRGKVVTFYIDVDNDNVADDLEKTVTNIVSVASFLKPSNTALFFGSGGTFHKFRITE